VGSWKAGWPAASGPVAASGEQTTEAGARDAGLLAGARGMVEGSGTAIVGGGQAAKATVVV
jgi:hypothetical protein